MIIGTAGHIDHGKTALVKALTGIDADRLAEEKARGITIELGFAYSDLGSGRISGFVDVPGHERLIRTMLAGAGGIDFALLVVAADDGPMPQTFEHLSILSLLGLDRGAVALTKCDLVDGSRLAEVSAQIREMLKDTLLAEAPILPVSAQSGAGIEALRQHLAAEDLRTPERPVDQPFRLAIDRSFTIQGAGTVVTGMALSGQVKIGDILTISPQGVSARVRSVHAQNAKSDFGHAGQRLALNLAGERLSKDAIHRGNIALAPDLQGPSNRIDAVMTVLSSESRPITTWFPVHLHSHAVEVSARVVPLEGPLHPGQTGLVQLVLEEPIAATVGDRFVLRDTSASRSIGGGHFVDLRAPARKRSTPERIALLSAAKNTNPDNALRELIALAPIERSAFQRDRALTDKTWTEISVGLVEIEGLALSQLHLEGLKAQVQNILAEYHAENPDIAGLGREKLRLALKPRLSKEVFLTFLRQEAEAKAIILDGAFLRLPSHEVKLAAEDEALFDRIYPQLLGEGRFRPPRVRDFANEFNIDEKEVRRVMRMVQKTGRVDQIAHDHFFAREVTQEMVAIILDVADKAEDGWFTAPAFRDRVNNGRKVAIEILDFFDRLGLTLRRGDLRKLNPHRLDLFGEVASK